MKYEIQTRFSAGWSNCWADLKTGKPVTFESREDADKELSQYNTDCAEAILHGDISTHDPEDYRVNEIETGLDWN